VVDVRLRFSLAGCSAETVNYRNYIANPRTRACIFDQQTRIQRNGKLRGHTDTAITRTRTDHARTLSTENARKEQTNRWLT
jgi:hypothetical protein